LGDTRLLNRELCSSHQAKTSLPYAVVGERRGDTIVIRRTGGGCERQAANDERGSVIGVRSALERLQILRERVDDLRCGTAPAPLEHLVQPPGPVAHAVRI